MGERFGLFNKTEWYGTDEGWWLRLVMAAIILVAVVMGIQNCTEGSLEKRLRDQEAREARAYAPVNAAKDKKEDAKKK